jgi:hypothetical protein
MLRESTNTPVFVPSPTCGRGLGRGCFTQQEPALPYLRGILFHKWEKPISAFLCPYKSTTYKYLLVMSARWQTVGAGAG